MILQHLDRGQQSGCRDPARADIGRDDGLGLVRVLADDGRGVFAAEGPAAFTRLAAGARRDVPFTPTDSAVAVAHLDNDRLELGEGTVRQNVRTYQRQADGPQLELLQLHCPYSTLTQPLR